MLRLKQITIGRVAAAFQGGITRLLSTKFDASFPNSQGAVVLKKGRSRLFETGGNPIIYDKAVEHVEGNPVNGDEVLVKDSFGSTIARGFYNDSSMYKVRIICSTKEIDYFSLPLQKLLLKRIRQAASVRSALGLRGTENIDSANESSDSKREMYRLINGEGDRLGGLVVDIMGPVIVAQSSAVWTEKHRKSIEGALMDLESCEESGTVKLVWKKAKSRLQKDGYVFGDESMEEKGPSPEDDIHDTMELQEGDLKYMVNAISGQKTGFYCDQRTNRQIIRSLAKGKKVLDLYCYTGAFTMNAMKGGAVEVTSVDSSLEALQNAKENLELNNISTDSVTLIKSDVPTFAKHLIDNGELFDVVVVDPPKLAPSRKIFDKAEKKYVNINALAMQLVKPGGVLMTCTCSGMMTVKPDAFRKVISKAAQKVNRDVRVLSKTGPAPDHCYHIDYPDQRYLSAYLLHIL